jgi:hypothetical protein
MHMMTVSRYCTAFTLASREAWRETFPIVPLNTLETENLVYRTFVEPDS